MMRDKIKEKNLYKKTKHIAIKIMTNLDTKKNKITPLYFYKEKREIRGGEIIKAQPLLLRSLKQHHWKKCDKPL